MGNGYLVHALTDLLLVSDPVLRATSMGGQQAPNGLSAGYKDRTRKYSGGTISPTELTLSHHGSSSTRSMNGGTLFFGYHF